MFKKIISLIIRLGIITLVFGSIYAAVQQSYRQSANDPQVSVAEDVARSLGQGNTLPATTSPVDVAQSLAPFINIYDASGKSLFVGGQLNGAAVVPPAGVFDYVHAYSEDRITWQPARDVRIATVVTSYQTASGTQGFVLVGRNLREVENREEHLGRLVLVSWMISVIFMVVLIIIQL